MKNSFSRSITAVFAGVLVLSLSACSTPEEKALNQMESVVAKIERQVDKGKVCASKMQEDMTAYAEELEAIARDAEKNGADLDNLSSAQEERIEEISGRMMNATMKIISSTDANC